VSSWDRIVRQHVPVVYTTAWRILGDAAETDGVVQEVFRRGREIARADRWEVVLRRLATTVALDRLRWRSPDDYPRGAAGRLRSALARLPSQEAAVFALRYFDALSPQEIAETLQLSQPAVAGYLDRARGRLEAMLAQVPGAA
jgi:DNA-directed RNA polymerase specialized sigma24 family protein